MSGAPRLHIRFSPGKPEQMEAWRILEAIPIGQRTEFVCGLIVDSTQKESIADIAYDAVKRALKEYQPNIQTAKPTEKETGEINKDILGFLKSL